MGDVSRWLSADHRRLEALFASALPRPDVVDPSPYEAFRRGLLRHIAVEEKLLLPAAQEAAGGRALDMAQRLRLDHGAIAALLVPTPTPSIVATLRAILDGHNAVEEGPAGTYAICDRLLAEQAASLVARMAAYPEPPASPHNDDTTVMPAVRRTLERAGYRLAGEASS
jgi:hypothetical protein